MLVTARGKQEHSKKEMNSIIQQGSIKLIESDSKVIYVTKDSISNQSCFYFIFIDSKNPKNKMHVSLHKNVKYQNCFQHW